MREAKVVLEGNAKQEYEKLNKLVLEELEKGIEHSEHISLLHSINQKIELLKINPAAGQPICKKRIPLNYFGNIDNLYRLEIAFYWRLLYTMRGDKVFVVDFILEIVDHKRYNKFLATKRDDSGNQFNQHWKCH